MTFHGRVDSFEVDVADLADPDQIRVLVDMVDAFARDPASGGETLDVRTRARLAPDLRARNAIVLFARDRSTREVLGLAIALAGYSTFVAREIINLHDLYVAPEARGRGAAQALLAQLERAARERGCAKLTLEVREDNARARALYRGFGFGDFSPGRQACPVLFLEKPI